MTTILKVTRCDHGGRIIAEFDAQTGEPRSVRFVNIHERALERAWKRLESGRSLSAPVVRRLLAALHDADQILEEENDGTTPRPAKSFRATMLRLSIGEASPADVGAVVQGMQRRVARQVRMIEGIQAEVAKRAQTRKARGAGAEAAQQQELEDIDALAAVLRNPVAIKLYMVRLNVFRQSLSAAAAEAVDLVFRDRAPETKHTPAGLKLLREDFPTGVTRLKEIIAKLPADVRPATKARSKG
jgi:hypothetical protein